MDENQLYDLFIKTYLLLSDGDRRFFLRYQLSQARYYAMIHIQNEPGISLTELSKRLLCTKGNTTRILNSLEQDGLLIRQLDAYDKRVYLLKLSENGHIKLNQVKSEYQKLNEDRFNSFSPEELKRMAKLIEILDKDLEGQLKT
ncbi:MAG: MarR family winged helix-turn-helix transcriptional regulator [Anaerolineaceae bacterium]